MKCKLMVITGLFFMGLLFMMPHEAEAQTFDNDVEILFLNQAQTFATIAVRDLETNIIWELRLAGDHPNKNAVLAVMLTAMSQDEHVRIRWEEGTPPRLLRVAINRLPAGF